MRSAGFAAAVIARHAARGNRPSRAAVVLLRQRTHSILLRAGRVRHVHQRWAVKIGLHVRHMSFMAARSQPIERTIRPISLVQDRMVVSHPRRSQPHMTARVEPIRQVTRRSPPHAPPPLALTIRRSAPPEPAPSSSSAETRAVIRVREASPTQPRPLMPLPPVELDRVADHVIRNLDRRLSSWRERRGKS